jgi:hypothetical protein
MRGRLLEFVNYDLHSIHGDPALLRDTCSIPIGSTSLGNSMGFCRGEIVVEPQSHWARSTLRLNNCSGAVLGSIACMTLALCLQVMIGFSIHQPHSPAALSEANLSAKGDYSDACPTKMPPTGKFADHGEWCAGGRSSARL